MGGKGSSGYHRRHMRIEDLSQPTATPFRRLDTISGLVVDLRYATANNFDGRVLYREWDCAWLRQEACAGLELAVGWLARERPGWRLVVLDALRPQRVQEAIWRDVAGTPAALYFADPARGSIHSYGMAVDATLRDLRSHHLRHRTAVSFLP
jgi:D-alanyl-D-alanine dipeptidase